MSPPPRILVLVTSTQRRGGEVFGEQIAHGLGDRGWDVSFRSLFADDGPRIAAEPLIRKPRSELSAFDVGVVSALRDAISDHRPDVVFANGGATLPIAFGSTVFRRDPRLVYGSIGEPLFWARGALARRRTGFLMRRCDLITAISHPTRRQIIDGLGVPEDNVVVAAPGVDPALLDLESEPSGGHLRVLFLGSLAPEKGPDHARAAVEGNDQMALRLVGGGPLLDDYRNHADGAEVIGPVDDVRPHLAWADVLVLPSRSEGLPGVVLEAGAAGVPTVGYDVGGVSDAVENGVTGLLVEPGNASALRDALATLAADPDRRTALGTAMRDRVRSRFTLKASIDRYDEVLRAVHEHRPIGDS